MKKTNGHFILVILINILCCSLGTFVQGLDSSTGVINEAFHEDPPPKYTPPPSYSAATSRSRLRRNLRIGSSITIDLPNLTQILSSATMSNSTNNTIATSVTSESLQCESYESELSRNRSGCSSSSTSGTTIGERTSESRVPTDEKCAEKTNSGKN